MHDLWRSTGGDALVVSDVGQHQMWEAQYYKHETPRSLITDHFSFPSSLIMPRMQARMPALQMSFTFKVRFAFFQKRFHPFVLVLAREAKRKQIDFAAQALVQI